MCGEDAADTTIRHTSEKSEAWAVAVHRIHVFERLAANNDCDNEDGLTDHPEYELASSQKLEQLIQVMRRLRDGSEDGDEDRARAN